MYNTSNDFNNACLEAFREVKTKVVFNGSDTLYGDSVDGAIVSITLEEGGEALNRLSIGSTPSSYVTIEMRMPSTPISLFKGPVQPFIGLVLPDTTTEWCPLGFFYITEISTSNDYLTATITAYDGMSRLNGNYVAQVASLPCSLEDIVDDICAQTGVTCDTTIFPAYQIEQIYEGSFKETLGYMAGLMGMSVKFNRDGNLEFFTYDTTSPAEVIGRNVQYLDGVTLLAEDVIVNSITSGTQENPLVVGNGYGINHPNPYMTQTILDDLAQALIGLTYTPLRVDWRGNPAIELGDTVSVTDKDDNGHTALVMQRSITSSMKDVIFSKGETEEQYAISKSPTEQRINQAYTALQSAIAYASGLINGTRGGIYRVTDSDNDGVNDGWLLSDSPDLQAAQRLIKANSAGIGLSTDGGGTYTTAITADGINASTITTGSMSAERIGVNGYTLSDYFNVDTDGYGHIVVKIGSSENSIILRQLSDRIEFSDGNGNILAYFKNDSFEIVDLSRFRIGSLAIITQTNGSVSFVRGD